MRKNTCFDSCFYVMLIPDIRVSRYARVSRRFGSGDGDIAFGQSYSKINPPFHFRQLISPSCIIYNRNSPSSGKSCLWSAA